MSLARDESKRLLKELQEAADKITFEHGSEPVVRRIINKQTHRIRFENESEDQVTIVIESKESDKQ
jgi:hypothetical protein